MASQSLLDCSEAAGLVNSMSGKMLILQHGAERCAAEMEHTVNTKFIKRLSDLDLGFEVKVGIGKLLALTKRALCMMGQRNALEFACDGIADGYGAARTRQLWQQKL